MPCASRPRRVMAAGVRVPNTVRSWQWDSLSLQQEFAVHHRSSRAMCFTERAARHARHLARDAGVFAAGDVRSGSVTVGEGAMAVPLVHEYLKGM